MNLRPARTTSFAILARPALRRIRRIVPMLCATVATLLLSVATARAANPAPAQLFYVPFPEDQLLLALQAIDATNSSADPVNPMRTYISIAAVADETILYVDQWENGYDPDIANPANLYSSPGNTGGTQIWGDGNPANGAPPGIPSDLIDAGTVIVLSNDVTTTNLGAIDFDGGDKIAATKTVAVSRTGWASGSNTLLAGSVEVFDTNHWGTDYRAPVGADIPDATDAQMFEYTSLAIQAGEGGATVQVDKDANGTFETTQTLGEGQSLFVNGGVAVGARVLSNRPVQVDILTGDIGSNYESRDSSLLPVDLWSTSYYEPVSTVSTAGTTVWLYNPGTTTLAVQYTTRISGILTTTSINVPGGTNGGYTAQVIPDGYGAHFEAASPFYAFSTTDSTNTSSGNQGWDWSFSLVPEDSLTPQVLIGLGIGRDPTSGTNPLENGNPVWVTPVGNGDDPVTVYADFDADPATGPLTDPNGNKYDASFTLKELERAKIYDTGDRNQTGMLVYTLTSGVKLAAAWGQDPTTASGAAPGLDVGTGVPPLPLFSAGKNGTLFTDNDGDGFVSPGDVLLYTIAINNISRAPVPNLRLTDTIPAGTAYVTGSTTLKIGSGPVNPIADDGSGTPFPLDGAGKVLDSSTALPVGGSYEVTFKVTIDSFANLPTGTTEILNVCSATAVFLNVGCRDTTPIYGRIGDFVWLDLDGDQIQDGGGEVGIANVTVNLWVDLNGNSVIDGADSIVATDVTDANGGYLFTGVPAGTYVVDVVNGPALANLTLTTANDPTPVALAGGEARLDVDFGYRNLCVQPNGQPVVCSNGGECSDPGVCQPATGLCSAPSPKADGTACTSDGNACTVDTCQAGACAHAPGNAGTVCRASAGDCDVAEVCTGSSATCPTDGFASSATVCRAQNGVCDVAEQCTGSSATCPADGVKQSGVVCRAANGTCDVAEACNGSGKDCPADGVKPSGVVCRAASGTCDVAEACDGSGTACPNDGFATAGTVCRAAAGACDVAEQCTGSSAACPTDGVKPSGTVCRASAGVCDVAEACNGTGAACPNDGFVAAGTQCRAANGQCDVAEACTGSGATCPNDGLKPDGSTCTDGDLCTQTDTCQGGSCVGADPVQCTALDQCHLPGTCEPSTGQCSNPTVADGTTCSDGDMCSAGDQCVGGVCTGVETLCERCADLEDNDDDGLIDCLDPDCPTCAPIVDTCNHPCVTQIIFQRRGLDLLRLQASFKPFTPIDPATEQVGLLITNANGVVLADLLAPGTVKRVGKSWTATVKASKSAGGIFKIRFTRLVDGTYRVNVKAYGAMKATATLPTMSVQILVGDDVSISTQDWSTIKTGWRVQLE